MTNLSQVNLYDLVPDSIRNDPQVAAAIQAVNSELQQVSQLAMVPAILSRLNSLTSNQLDHLAWQFKSKVWRDSWPLNLKRSVIKNVITSKYKKGTKFAVLQALSAYGSAAFIREWFENDPPGIPHTFDITLSVNNIPGETTADTLNNLQDQISVSKAARSTFNISLATKSEGIIYSAAASRAVTYTRLEVVDTAVDEIISASDALYQEMNYTVPSNMG